MSLSQNVCEHRFPTVATPLGEGAVGSCFKCGETSEDAKRAYSQAIRVNEKERKVGRDLARRLLPSIRTIGSHLNVNHPAWTELTNLYAEVLLLADEPPSLLESLEDHK
jgi:hypothetical protein